MKAWKLKSEKTLVLEDLKAEDVDADSVKIKILAFGASLVDVLGYKGVSKVKYPIIPCRQCIGFVSEVGENVRSLQRGDRVAVYPALPCENCSACADGRPYDCENQSYFGSDIDGFARDFATVKASALYDLPEKVETQDALFVESIATAINITTALDLQKGEHIVIVGATVLGLVLAQVAMYYQAIPILLDVREDRLELARSLGIALTVNTVESDAGKKIFSITGGHMAETVAYMLDSDLPVQRCADYSAVNGRMALAGWCTDEVDLSLRPFMEKNMRLLSVKDCGKNFSAAINMLVNKSVSVEPLISHTEFFDDFDKVIADYAENKEKYIKLIFKFKK